MNSLKWLVFWSGPLTITSSPITLCLCSNRLTHHEEGRCISVARGLRTFQGLMRKIGSDHQRQRHKLHPLVYPESRRTNRFSSTWSSVDLSVLRWHLSGIAIPYDRTASLLRLWVPARFTSWPKTLCWDWTFRVLSLLSPDGILPGPLWGEGRAIHLKQIW